MGKFTILDHPLVKHKITLLRSKHTEVQLFRQLMQELSMMLAYEATRCIPVEKKTCETPLMQAEAFMISTEKLAIVPILRAGLGMVDGLLSFMPMAKVGHVGLYRDHESLQPVEYYCKLPENISEMEVFVVDPMLATGGSVARAIDVVKRKGAKHISFLCVVSCPEGVAYLQKAHADVDIFTCALDKGLNEKGYILPGLGDAGDRLYGTK